MAQVSLGKVIKKYGDVQAIHGVDLQIPEGAFCVFVGPSGCGKSTLLRMIAGLEETTDGRIVIGERDVTHADPAKRGVAMVFQTYALFPHMTVRENMSFGLKIGGADKEEIRQKVDNAAQILKLHDYMDRKPKALSGGQRQRVAIGRAIVRQPDVFLFDEPLSNLDAELRVQMRIEIAKLHQQLGATMIYVTHDQVEAMTMADVIVVLRDGRIEQSGSPVELYSNPDNRFVAGFIGSPRMNFLPATVVASGDGITVISPDGLDGLEIPVKTMASPAVGSQIVMGLRPEQFSPDGALRLSLDIDVIENLGGVAYAYGTAGNAVADQLVVELRGALPANGAQKLDVGFNAGDVLLFDAGTDQRIR
ncbi:sn-glycerol-3-phosphate ABC transporter ATP-binding protein UgpC [Shimia biformata]|uniref:ABC transporter ATP-binding protein n=1 Tax=Shimia biformata TaxID=1294299 RepID=UPI003083F442